VKKADLTRLEAQLEKLAETNQALHDDNEELKEELELLQEDLKYTDERVKSLLPVKNRISGYLDFGFFATTGDGSGIRNDFGHFFFPEYAGQVADSWVFMGDPLSTMVNARGEPAETAESRALTFDGIDNQGVSSFAVNALNLQLFTGLGTRLSLQASVDFVPRNRNPADPDGHFLGDFVDVKLAYAEYRAPVESFKLNLYAGKFESVLGREYRRFEATDMITVTPSLLCRYLCGRPLGIKGRVELWDGLVTATAAVTNGSANYEHFGFYNEIDSNHAPTGSARLSLKLPIGSRSELGASGAFGAQDLQTENDVYQWHVGADLFIGYRDFELTGEYVQGKAEGATEDMDGAVPCGISECIDYKGAYGLLSYRATNMLIPYVRVDWRDALHQAGASFVYISKLIRFTGGLRAEVGQHLIFKGEYTVNRELGRVPSFPNDTFTTAMIVKY
jgi:hypothetical protein